MGRDLCRAAGLTLLELVVALAILAGALLALISAIYQSNLLQAATRERILAYNAARAQLERIRGEPLHEIYARYNSDPADDPAGPGTAPGPAFDVEGLAPPSGERAGHVGFPEAGRPPVLREDVADATRGMVHGRDLNRDGVIDSAPRSKDYCILPVRIVVMWQGTSGINHLEVDALLTDK